MVGCLATFEHSLHLLVGKAMITLDDSMCEVPPFYISLLVEFEYHTVSQFFLVGTQRTDEITETLGEHWDGAVNEIDTRGALHCLLVDY